MFLENYSYEVARILVQGVDIWLNNPRRPLEASGTSGMKASVNGALHLSVLDGWWCEAYKGDNGWAIGSGEEYSDNEYQDNVESLTLYDLLESEVVPLFYRRGSDGLPREWIARMKESIMSICPAFNTNRMVEEYTERIYLPANLQGTHLSSNDFEMARDLASWKQMVEQHWKEVFIQDVCAEGRGRWKIGDEIQVRATVSLGALQPEDVAVELYFGPLNGSGGITDGVAVIMAHERALSDREHIFSGGVPCVSTGCHGFTVRVRPFRKNQSRSFDPPRVVWWNSQGGDSSRIPEVMSVES